MNKAIFLDRDGVINIDDHYVHRREDFVFVDGIFDLCRKGVEAGYKIIVITNQSGIERGYYTEDDFRRLTGWMCGEFALRGITISWVYHCPSLTGPNRKPNPGLFLQAVQDFDIDPAQSLGIGDKKRDVEAGFRAGVKTNLLYLNEEEQETASDEEIPPFAAVIHHLQEAERYL